MRNPGDDHSFDHSYEGFNCDIFAWTEKMCIQHLAPKSLCCGVYTCGPEYSAMAFDAPQGLIDRCRLNMSVVMVGRRNTINDHFPGGDMCTDYGNSEPPSLFGKRSKDLFSRYLESFIPPPHSDMFVTDQANMFSEGFPPLSPFQYLPDPDMFNGGIPKDPFAPFNDSPFENPFHNTDKIGNTTEHNNTNGSNNTADNNISSDDHSSERNFIVYSKANFQPDAVAAIINLKVQRWCRSLSR